MLDQRPQQGSVAVVQAVLGDAEHGQRLGRQPRGDGAVGFHLGVVAHALEQAVGDPRRAARARRDRVARVRPQRHAERHGAAADHLAQLRGAVEVEPLDDPEAVPQRRGEHRVAGGRADQGERLERVAHAARARPGPDHDVDLELLHRGIEHLLDAGRQAVDFVDEEHVARVQRAEDAGQVALPLDGRAGGGAQRDAELAGDDPRQRGLAQTGRAVEQQVVERLAAPGGRLDRDPQRVQHRLLADEFVQPRGAQRSLALVRRVVALRVDDAPAGGAFLVRRADRGPDRGFVLSHRRIRPGAPPA